jgi:hypothetical protein
MRPKSRISTVDPHLENLRRKGKLFACKGRIMDTLPQLSPEQTAALDVLVDLFRATATHRL